MFDVDLKIAPKGKWNFKPGNDLIFKAAALKAMKFLFHRIHKQGKDANGQRLPNLLPGNWFFFSAKDPRWNKIRGKKAARRKKDAPPPKTIFFTGGYAGAKKAVGAKPKRDGWFSGAMWASLTPQVKKIRGELHLRLYFAKSTKTHESQGTRRNPKTGRIEIVWKRKSVRNRTKAWWMQILDKRSKSGGVPKFILMQFTNAETTKIVQQILPGYHFNGSPLVQGRHQKFPRFN